MDNPREHCGLFGIFGHTDAARQTYFGLHALQHRGQESAGIVTSVFDEERGRMTMPAHKDFGLVLDAFNDPAIFHERLFGQAAIGHTRYSTSGSSTNPANIQPFVVHYQEGSLALAHNGNLSNAPSIRERLVARGTLFNSSSDSELILHLAAQSEKSGAVERIVDALHQCEGAFSLVMMTDEAIIAVRDPNGFRPLALGRIEHVSDPAHKGGEHTPAWVVASETCAFDLVNAEYVRDVEPGEILIIDRKGVDRVESGGEFESVHLPRHHGTSQCIFEYVYFSRPDSRIFGAMVDKVRRKLGKQLAHDAPLPTVPNGEKRPLVISVPDSSNTAAIGYVSEANKLGDTCKLDIGLIRNHYVGRTFISPGQSSREMKVKTKFNTVDGVLKDRVVVMIDDSIVRGTTARQLVRMVREAGAREVHFRVASPPVQSPCFYGMDFPTHEELAINRFDDQDALAAWLGVDSLGYLSRKGMLEAVGTAHDTPEHYCDACFSGEYPVPVERELVKEENDW